MSQNSSESAFKQDSLQEAKTIDKQGRLDPSTQALVSANGQISPDIRGNRVRYIQPDTMLEDMRNRNA